MLKILENTKMTVYDYSTWYTERVVTRLVHQPLGC